MENLFDLSKLGSQYSGYFVDREGKVYSNKQGTLRALKVSAPSNTFNKYCQLELICLSKLSVFCLLSAV